MATLDPRECLKLRNKSIHLKIQVEETEYYVVSLFDENPCARFKESEFTFFDRVAMGPWTRETLANHEIRFDFVDSDHGQRIRHVTVLADIERRDEVIENIVAALNAFNASGAPVSSAAEESESADAPPPGHLGYPRQH